MWHSRRVQETGRKELYGLSQANVNYFGAWHCVLWSMDFIPQYFFVDRGIRWKRLESVAGGGSICAPGRTDSILGVDQQASGPVRDQPVKGPGRWINYGRHCGGAADHFICQHAAILSVRPQILADRRRTTGAVDNHCMLDSKEAVGARSRIRQRISAWPVSHPSSLEDQKLFLLFYRFARTVGLCIGCGHDRRFVALVRTCT